MNRLPVLAIKVGFVVTPSTYPVAARSRISFVSAVSMKNFMRAPSASPKVYPMADMLATRDGESRADEKRVGVVFPLPLDSPYDYRVPAGLALAEGDIVAAPFGARIAAGVVWGAGTGDVAEVKLKSVAGRFDAPPLGEGLRRFIAWTAHYTLNPLGAVLRMALSVPKALDPPKPVAAFALADGAAELVDSGGIKLTASRKRVVAVLRDGPPRPATELAREAATGPGVVRSLVTLGLLRPVALSDETDPPAPDPSVQGPTLSAPQREAADRARCRGGQGVFGHLGRRRHRLGQDGGLFRGHRRRAHGGASGAGAGAGNLAHRAVARAVRAPLRRATGGMALGSHRIQPPPRLARHRLPAAPRSWSGRARRCICRCPRSA